MECECDSIEKKRTESSSYYFHCYKWKLREWFALLFALLVIPILAHTCWIPTFSCLCRERTVYYMIVLIPAVLLPYALVSNCYLVMIFFIRITCEKFEFTLHATSWSFANIIILCRLGSVHVVFLSYYYRERTELKWKMYMIRPFPNKNWREFQNFHICPCSAVDSAQWDWVVSTVIDIQAVPTTPLNVPYLYKGTTVTTKYIK